LLNTAPAMALAAAMMFAGAGTSTAQESGGPAGAAGPVAVQIDARGPWRADPSDV